MNFYIETIPMLTIYGNEKNQSNIYNILETLSIICGIYVVIGMLHKMTVRILIVLDIND